MPAATPMKPLPGAKYGPAILAVASCKFDTSAANLKTFALCILAVIPRTEARVSRALQSFPVVLYHIRRKLEKRFP